MEGARGLVGATAVAPILLRIYLRTNVAIRPCWRKRSQDRLYRYVEGREKEQEKKITRSGYRLRWRILARMRRFLRPTLRRPLPVFFVPTRDSVRVK